MQTIFTLQKKFCRQTECISLSWQSRALTLANPNRHDVHFCWVGKMCSSRKSICISAHLLLSHIPATRTSKVSNTLWNSDGVKHTANASAAEQNYMTNILEYRVGAQSKYSVWTKQTYVTSRWYPCAQKPCKPRVTHVKNQEKPIRSALHALTFAEREIDLWLYFDGFWDTRPLPGLTDVSRPRHRTACLLLLWFPSALPGKAVLLFPGKRAFGPVW